MNLHEFQLKAQNDITQAAAEGNRRILLCLPTGAGKTLVASHIIKHAISNNNRVLFLAHRRELIYQPVDRLESCGVTDVGTMLSGDPYATCFPVTIASVQTMHSWVVRKKKEIAPKADLVVVDEAHHLTGSKTWQDILTLYPEAFILGMTATPISRSGKGLGEYFDCLIQGPTIKDLTNSGYLVPVRYFAPSLPDLAKVKIRNGDYAEDELERIMDSPKLIGDILDNWAKFAKDRKTVVFASGVKHSIHIAESFNAIGIKAAHLDGNTPREERKQILDDLENGKIQVLSNCAVLTEGWDSPSVSCLVFARPTKSLLLYLQVAGRVLRTSPGKENCLILDHSGVVYEHGMVTEDREWKLEYLKDIKKSEALKKLRLRKTITCRNCKAVYDGVLTCPYCHTKPEVKGKPIETYEAYLQALDEVSAPPQVDKRKFYAELKGFAEIKKRKPGTAYYRFKEKFGHFPSNVWRWDKAQTPTLETLSWCKSQDIRWAMSQKKNKPKRMDNIYDHVGKVESHGYGRIEKIGKDAYVREVEIIGEEEQFA